NQFPTGAVTPVGRRYQLLSWAEKNNSYIIEDDYDSELRYFGKPVPALQGLDTRDRVVYLGSFSSTLFASIKISYMVLPEDMAKIFDEIRKDYAQTCSKAEQLTLALFMEKGYYQTGIKKLRRLYAQKLAATAEALGKNPYITPVNTSSGVNMIINVNSEKSARLLCEEARSIGILTLPVVSYTEKSPATSLIFYYNQLQLSEIPTKIEGLCQLWFENKR
ncbi:MAG: PLP-dependent aminotransferase family protein, partial [Anaerovoracaceae bacterium]